MAHIDRGDGEVPRHVAIVPLRFHEEVGGVLLLADKEMRGGSATGFDDDDDGMLESFAMQAGSELRNASRHQDLIWRIDRAAAAATAKVDPRCCAKTYDPSRGVGVSTRLRLKETVQFVGEGLRVPLAIR